MKATGLVVLGLLAVGALGFIGVAYDTGMYKFWAPKQENIRREVFTNTQSFVQGKISYLTQLRLDYETAADGPQKRAVRSMILNEANQVNHDLLPANLRGFIEGLE